MKKFIALMIAAVMVIGVIGLVGCGKNPDTTTTEAPAPVTTTSTTTEASTTTTTTTEATTTVSETTTEAVQIQTTTLPAFLRFDFGTDTKAQDDKQTSHEWLKNNLTYNEDYLKVEFLEDSWRIYALKDYADGTDANAFAICFENIVDLDYDDLVSGWGTWSRYPAQSGKVGKSWEGKHQYMKIRIKNMTLNNMISFQFKCNGGFSTTANVSNMYLQGGMGKGSDKDTVAKEISNEWRVYYYDIPMCCQACSYAYGAGRNGIKCSSYSEWLEKNAQTGGNNGLNWTQNATGLRFNLLGAVYYFTSASVQAAKPWCDSRANIKRGNCVEVDYIVFGSTVEQLEAFKSKMEIAGTK